MKRNILFIMLMFILSLNAMADDDIMITRDGAEREVKIDRITNEQVFFTDLKKKKRGIQSFPTTFVYLIKTEKRGNIFFDEDGNQITRKQGKIGSKDDVVYLTSCEEIVVYDLIIEKDVIKYKETDKKKAPYVTKKKEDVFMIRHGDGSKDLFSGVKTDPTALTNAPIPVQQQNASSPPTQPVSPSAPPVVTPPVNPNNGNSNVVAAPQISQPASGAPQVAGNADFLPALDTDPQTIINKVYAANPYVLHRKGAIAEYRMKSGDKDTYIGGVATYLHLIVTDETVQNGLVKVSTRYAAFNKEHEPSKGISAKWKETSFVTEIDSAGNYHLTNDIINDLIIVTKRQGYAALIPGNVTNNTVKTNRMITSANNEFGGTVKIQRDFSSMRYVGVERVTTPAGEFECIKLSGEVAVQTKGIRDYTEHYTWWLARNVGFVRIDRTVNKTTNILYLNSISGI